MPVETPKLKSKRRVSPLWLRIVDVLRLAKPFDLWVNMSAYHTQRTLRSFAHLQDFREIIDEKFPYAFEITIREIKENYVTIEGWLEADPNLEITHITGKVYSLFGLRVALGFTIMLNIVMWLNSFGQSEAAKGLALVLAACVLSGFALALHHRNRVLNNFKQLLNAKEEKRLVEDVKAEAFRQKKRLKRAAHKANNHGTR
jgi:hypothetical protein